MSNLQSPAGLRAPRRSHREDHAVNHPTYRPRFTQIPAATPQVLPESARLILGEQFLASTYQQEIAMSQQPAPLSYAQPPQQSTAREGFLLRFCAALIDAVISLVPYLIGVVVAKVAGVW